MLLAKEDNWTDRGSKFASPETEADLGTGGLSEVLRVETKFLKEKLDTKW